MLKSFFKDTIIYGVAAVLPRVINLALVAIFTYVLGKADFSDQTQWYVYAAFINVILTMGTETSFFRYYTKESDKNKVLASAAILLIISSGIFLLIGFILANQLSDFLGFSDKKLLYILILTTVVDTICVIPFAYIRVTGRPLVYTAIKLTNVIVLFVFTVIFLMIIPKLSIPDHSFFQALGFEQPYKPGVLQIIMANLIASIFTLLLLVPYMKKFQWKPDKSMMIKLLNYGWPIMVGGIAYTVNENMDKLLIEDLISKEANGVYAACYKLGVFMTLYIMAFRLGAEPFFFRVAGSENAKSNYSTIMTWFVILGCIFMVVITGYLDLLAGIIIKNNIYLEGLYIVPILLLANLFSGIYNNLSIWYKLTDKTRYGMYISIIGAIIAITTLLIFVPALGILGGAVSTLITYILMALISWYFGHKYYPVAYDVGKISVYILVAAMISVMSFWAFRDSLVIRTGLTLPFIFLVYFLEKGNLQNVLSKTKDVV